MSEERVIVSMTSYPARIKNVSKSIFALLMKQTRKPDEIHLWLAIPQFPNKENDLPNDLQIILNHPSVFIHWLDKDIKVHKRHEYFKNAKDNECVFLIDDDVYYSNDLIENVMNHHAKFPNCIICYNQYSPHEYTGKKILYNREKPENKPEINYNRWCGQSMIPAKLYPKIILDDEHQTNRDICSPSCDECWFQPWTVAFDIPIYHLHYGWGEDISKDISKWDGLCKFTHEKESNGYERRDNWLNNVLKTYPFIYEKYKKLFNYN